MAGQDKWYFTKEILQNSPSRRCGIDADKELAYRQQAANFIQDMGQRLHVSQLCINTAIVYMHRFYAFHSFTHFHRNAMAAAALFLAAKMEEQPRKLEYVIKVAYLCLHRDCQHTPDVRSEYYQEQAQDLVFNENVLLQTLGFDVAIDHPHTHVVKTCSLIRASKDLAQTSYFMASNSLHLTTMCLQYKPTVVACFCIHLASKWSNWEIPQSNEGKHWFNYVDKTVTAELLEHLTSEFLHIFDKCPSRLKKKIKSMPNSQGSPSQLAAATHTIASSPFDKEPRKILQEESDRSEQSKHLQGSLGPPLSASSTVNKIDHREYRERQRRAAAAAAASASGGSGSSNNAAPSGSMMQRPPHRWPHPPREPNSSRDMPRDAANPKESDVPGVPHSAMRNTNLSRDQALSNSRDQPNMREVNARESNSSDHNGIRDVNSQRDSSREGSGIRERDVVNQRDHNSQREGILSNSVHQSVDNMRLNNDVRNNSVRDSSVSGNIKESSSGKDGIGREGREHSSSVMAREGNSMMRDVTSGQGRPISGHRDSSSRHNGSSSVPQQRSSHQRHLPPTQGAPSESRQRSSQSNPVIPRPPQVLPTPVPPQRPPSLFSPPEPQRKPQINQKPLSQPIQSPLLSIPREALVPAPLSPFSSPNELESKPIVDTVEHVKKEEIPQIHSNPQSILPAPSIEPEALNNLETDPNLVSSLLKEAIPHRSEKKKKKEKHKHKDKKDKKDKHKKKDKKRESEQSNNSHSNNSGVVLPQPIVSNSNNLSIKITLPRESVANVLPPINTAPSISDSSPLGKLTIKIPKERIKIEPPTPPVQMAMSQPPLPPQALKIKIPKELVERENRKRPMVGQSGSREGPPNKSSRSQGGVQHQLPTKISHHSMGNGQSNSNYHK